MRNAATQNRIPALGGLLLTAVLAAGLPKLACSADQDAGAGDSQLVDIVVTAQRRSEPLQSVPISVQVISGQSLADRNLNSLVDLSQTVPSVHVTTGAASGDMYIRGIGSGAQQSFDQSVGTFVDDIYHGRARLGDQSFLDHTV